MRAEPSTVEHFSFYGHNFLSFQVKQKWKTRPDSMFNVDFLIIYSLNTFITLKKRKFKLKKEEVFTC